MERVDAAMGEIERVPQLRRARAGGAPDRAALGKEVAGARAGPIEPSNVREHGRVAATPHVADDLPRGIASARTGRAGTPPPRDIAAESGEVADAHADAAQAESLSTIGASSRRRA